MTVESARREHLGAVAALEREFFGAPASEAQLARAMERGDTVLLCALGENGTLLGCADFQFVLDEGYIGNVAVQSAHRRQGIGEALMRAMIAEARARSLAFLTLEVRESNAAARAYMKNAALPSSVCGGIITKSPRKMPCL